MLRLAPLLLGLLLLAGCSSPAPVVTDAVPPAPAPASTATVVQHDGTLAIGNCSETPGGTACVFNIGNPADPRAANIDHVPFEDVAGFVLSTAATLTWQSTSPLTDSLELRLSLLSCGDDGCATEEVLATATGPSPLTLQLEDILVPAGLTLGTSVTRAEAAPGHRVSTLQDFHVDATAVH